MGVRVSIMGSLLGKVLIPLSEVNGRILGTWIEGMRWDCFAAPELNSGLRLTAMTGGEGE
jgi:hypothetical protein